MTNIQITKPESAIAEMSDEEYRAVIVNLNEQDLGQAYNPLKTVITIKDEQFRVKQTGVEEPIARFSEMDVQIINAKMARALYLHRDQKVPTCSSVDYVNGNLNPRFAEEVPEGVGGLCSACPFNQWDSDVDKSGNPKPGKRCKERRNILLLHPDFNRPLVLSLAPSSIGRWDGYADRLASKRPPSNYIEYITRASIELKKDGANEYGVVKFVEHQILTKQGALAVLPLRKQYADWLGKVQVDVKEVLGEDNGEMDGEGYSPDAELE